MSAIHDEVDELWKGLAARYRVAVPPGILFTDTLKLSDKKAQREATKYLQPQLAIFEQCLQWLVALYATVDRRVSAGHIGVEDRAPVGLIGAAATYGVAIRRLVISGLDHPARAVLRSLAEFLQLSIVTLHNPDLRRGFKQAEDEDEAREFWYLHLTNKKIDARLTAIENELGFPPEVRAELRQYRIGVSKWLSQFVHPTWLAAELAARTSSARDPERFEIAMLGACSIHSVGTLDLAIKNVWYFAHVGYELLLRPYGHGFHHPDPDDGIDTIVTVGHDVVASLGLKYWSDASRSGDLVQFPGGA